MTNLFLASAGEMAAFVAALGFFVVAVVGGIIWLVFSALGRVTKKEVTRLNEGKSPFTGRSLSASTLQSDKCTRKKFSHYRYGNVTVTKTGKDSARITQSSERVEKDEWVEGVEVERWKDFDTNFTLLMTQTRRCIERKNPEDVIHPLQFVEETYCFKVENYGTLTARQRFQLRNACRKASFVNKREF